MRLTKFNDLPGDSPLAKLTTWSRGRPIYTQIKHHGIFAEWIPSLGLFTRQGKQWSDARLPAALLGTLKSKDLVIQGELVVPDVPFQTLCGELSVNAEAPFPPSTQLRVFDMLDPRIPTSEQPLGYRLALLAKQLETENFKIVLTETHHIPEHADRAYNESIGRGHEGVVYRCSPCWHAGGSRGPNPDAVKRKRSHTAEGTCIRVVEGNGKRRGQLGSMELRLDNGRVLRLGGGAGLDEPTLVQLLKCPPIGRAVTFSYEELSEDGIPLRPQLVSVRDYE